MGTKKNENLNKTHRLDLRVSQDDIDIADRLKAHFKRIRQTNMSRAEVIRYCILRVFELENRIDPVLPLVKRRPRT